MPYKPIAFEVFKYSLKAVEKNLAAGENPVFVDAVPSRYDEFFAMCDDLGVLEGFEKLTDTRKNPCVPLSAICVLMMCRFLRCIQSFGQMGEVLLCYAPLLERLGIAARESVYNCRRSRQSAKNQTPLKVFDEEVFSEVLRDLDHDELNAILTRFITALRQWKPSLFSEGLFIMDSNHFRITGTGEEYKWCALMLRTEYGMIPVALEFSATEGEGTGETRVGRKLLERVLDTYGQGFLKTVLMDAGYLDGASLRWLKFEQGVDWMVPTKEKMVCTNALLGEAADAPKWRWRTVKPPQLNCSKTKLPTRKMLWIENVAHFPEYGAKVNGIVIRDVYSPTETHAEEKTITQCIASSNMDLKGAEIHDLWRKRWNIESAFGFMTEYWGLGKWQIRNLAVYEATIQLMALTYGLVVLQHLRDKLQPLSLRKLKFRFELQVTSTVLICCGDACALLTTKTLNDWMMRGILVVRSP